MRMPYLNKTTVKLTVRTFGTTFHPCNLDAITETNIACCKYAQACSDCVDDHSCFDVEEKTKLRLAIETRLTFDS